MSPSPTRSASGSDHLSTEAIYTPLAFPQQTTMAAEPALSNTPSIWVTTREITPIHYYPCPPMSYNNTINPLFPPPNPSLPPNPPLPPAGVPLPRLRQHRPRPVVCEKHFEPSLEDAAFLALMNRTRAHPELREPGMLKGNFLSRKKGCPDPTHTSTCFNILVGPLRGQCRTESTALRDIQNVLGLCWTCNTW